MRWQRARKPEQKKQRRVAILKAAMRLYKRHCYDEISLSAVARNSGISKANIYRYFESKEVIFLHILFQDMIEWADSLEQKLTPLAKTNNIEAVAHILAGSIASRPRMSSLLAIVSSVLEKNVTMDSALWFKTSTHQTMERIIQNIHTALPNLTNVQASFVVRYLIVLNNGFWPIANPSSVCKKIMEMKPFKEMAVDLSRDLEPAVLIILRGLFASEK